MVPRPVLTLSASNLADFRSGRGRDSRGNGNACACGKERWGNENILKWSGLWINNTSNTNDGYIDRVVGRYCAVVDLLYTHSVTIA